MKPLIFREINSHCQVDRIEFLPRLNRKYKFKMMFQNHLTIFIILKDLPSKREEEVAYWGRRSYCTYSRYLKYFNFTDIK